MTLKKFIITLYIGMISLMVISISFSFAWFVASAHLFINTINVNLRGEAHLFISHDDVDYVEKISYSDKDSDGNLKLQEVEEFIPVSSMMNDKWLGNNHPIFYDCSSDLIADVINPKEVGYGYYQQKLYLKTDIDYFATLDVEKTIFTPNHEANEIMAKENREVILKEMKMRKLDLEEAPSVEEVSQSMDDLIYALRLSLYFKDDEGNDVYYIYDPYKESVTYYGGLLDNHKDGYFDTYYHEDGQLYEILYGDINDRNLIVYDSPTTDEDIDLGKSVHYYGNSFNGLHHDSAYQINMEESLKNGLVIKEELSLDNDDVNNGQLLIPLERNVSKEIIISIYLEGWDLDLYNASQGASFSMDIAFKLIKGGLK